MKAVTICLSLIGGLVAFNAWAEQTIGSGPNLKCSAYLLAEITQPTKTAEGPVKDPVLLADNEAILKYLATVQAEINGDFQEVPNQKRWENFFHEVFREVSRQVEKNFVVFTGDNYPNPIGLGSLIGLKNYIFTHPSNVLPIRVIAPAWLDQVLHWANYMAFAARGAAYFTVAQQKYIAYLLDQLLPNFILQNRDYAAQVELAREVFHKYVNDAVSVEAGLPQVLLRKVEFSSLASFTKDFSLITQTWQSYIEQNYQDVERYLPYGVDMANLYYSLRQDLVKLDYGGQPAEEAWSKFWQKYVPADLQRRPPTAAINKAMLYTLWHGNYELRDTEFDPVKQILHQSLMETLKGQTRLLNQGNASPEVVAAWIDDLSFILLGPKPPKEDDVVSVFYLESELHTLQAWQAAVQKFFPDKAAGPNFLPLVAAELRFQNAAAVMQHYRFYVAGDAFDIEGKTSTSKRAVIQERAQKSLEEVQKMLGLMNSEDFLEKYLAEQWHNFADPFSGPENRWISRESLAGMLQAIYAQPAENLHKLAQRSLIDFVKQLST
ncbi:MAG: hypothetical protein J6Y94_03150, partial [Bacteriovoracaceae bacterium]|nr:hypothetical protein [Bacteriovoracaceae bacterium]